MEKTVYSRYLRKFRCKYSITRTVKTFTTGSDKVNSYGIKIEKIANRNKKESIEIKHVGINELDVKIYLKELYDNFTTPEKLKEKLLAS